MLLFLNSGAGGGGCELFAFRLNYRSFDFVFREGNLALKLVAAVLLGIWLLLVLLGKGGLVHILLLNGLAVAVVDLVSVYRRRITE